MKYSREVIDLMGAYPGRDFQMKEITRYVMTQGHYDKHAVRRGVARVLEMLIESSTVMYRPPRASRGSFALYRWKVIHDAMKSETDSATLGHPKLYLYESEIAET